MTEFIFRYNYSIVFYISFREEYCYITVTYLASDSVFCSENLKYVIAFPLSLSSKTIPPLMRPNYYTQFSEG